MAVNKEHFIERETTQGHGPDEDLLTARAQQLPRFRAAVESILEEWNGEPLIIMAVTYDPKDDTDNVRGLMAGVGRDSEIGAVIGGVLEIVEEAVQEDRGRLGKILIKVIKKWAKQL